MEKNIFIYWIGKEYKLLKILRELIYLHSNNEKNYKVHFLNDNNIKEYIKNIPPKYYKLRPAHKADFVRVNVICDYGGIWLDSDTIVMNDLSSLFKILEEKDGFFIKQHNNLLINGVFGSKKNTQILKKWKLSINKKLQNNSKINWISLGSEILNIYLKKNNNLYNNFLILNGKNNILPVFWKYSVNEFLIKPFENYENIKREYQPLIILYKHIYIKYENIIKENIPINYFIKKSYENIKY